MPKLFLPISPHWSPIGHLKRCHDWSPIGAPLDIISGRNAATQIVFFKRDHQHSIRDHLYGCRGGNRFKKGGLKFDKKKALISQ